MVAPLARANGAHARALVDALAKEPLTSRQLHGFWQHYRKANRALREKMAADPVLFFKSLAARQAEDQHRLADGPEEQWRPAVDRGQYPCPIAENSPQGVLSPARHPLPAPPDDGLYRRQRCFERLQRTIGRLCNEKHHRQTVIAMHQAEEHPADQRADENVAKDHPAHPGRPCARDPQPAKPL